MSRAVVFNKDLGMFSVRKDLKTCQVLVGYESFGDGETPIEQICGKTAIATWSWDDEVLYACEKHDCEIVEQGIVDR